MPFSPKDITFEEFSTLIKAFENNHQVLSLPEEAAVVSFSGTSARLPREENQQIFSLDRRQGDRLFFCDISKTDRPIEVSINNFKEIFEKIYQEKSYLMVVGEPCRYLPFKRMIEDVFKNIEEQIKGTQTNLDMLSLFPTAIIPLILGYMKLNQDEVINSIKLHGFFDSKNRAKPDLPVTKKELPRTDKKHRHIRLPIQITPRNPLG